MSSSFDVIIIGAGHAGCEAAHAAARLGAHTLLITQNLDTIGQMSCNPAIGGLGKGHLVREIDALGGLMATIADQTAIQFRLLNRRKGPAVRGPRAQIDKSAYRRTMRQTLDQTPNLTYRQAEAANLIQHQGRISAITTRFGETYTTKAVVLTTGTFLNGLVHMGDASFPAGRLNDPPSTGISSTLTHLGLTLGRLKTGTPPRLDGRTIQWSALVPQYGDADPYFFSFLTPPHPREQWPCHITHTTPETHRIIQENLHLSAMYGGRIHGIGPRYCPSIEDKVVRFADKEHHQIFLEPEGSATTEIYPNGLSTSLPLPVQWRYIQSIPGLEHAEIIRPGYAIEYDFVDPRQLDLSLAVRTIPGLYHAGQINGTTGYEEAAAQGLIAGINAALFSLDRPPLRLDRASSYIGVMIDDLITQGVDEPYRMFTSRSEFRLLLRTDNADARLTPIGRALGLVDDHRHRLFVERQEQIQHAIERLKETRLPVDRDVPRETSPLTAWELMRRSDVEMDHIFTQCGMDQLPEDVRTSLSVEAYYQGYIQRQQQEVEKVKRSDDVPIPGTMEWNGVMGLSTEIRQKLTRVRPTTLGQAARIPGVTPSALSVILFHLRRSPT